MPVASLAARVTRRRELLRVAGVLSRAAGLIGACSAPEPAAPPAAPPAAKATAAAAPTAAATVATQAKPAPAASGEATLVLGVDAESLDPLVTTNAFSRSMMKAIFDTLVVLDPQLAPQPALATSWETPNDTTWRFKLRQGVKFHDGSPFNATVAKYSLDRFVGPNPKNTQAAWLKPITAVKVVDAATLELTTDGPCA